MQIVKPYARIVDVPDRAAGIKLLQFCEYAARISHRSEDKVTDESWDRFLRSIVLQHGDLSVIEHRIVTVEFLVDRGITHEIVRHRLASFTQESTRFVNYEKKMPPSFIVPLLSDEALRAGNGEQTELSQEQLWRHAINTAESSYRQLITSGCSPQIARSVFPNALASKLWMTCNLRQWRHFFLMRTSAEAHPQMKQVTLPLLGEFKEKIPIIYEDIIPGMKQSQNMQQMR